MPPNALPPHASGTSPPTTEPAPTQSQMTRLSIEETSAAVVED